MQSAQTGNTGITSNGLAGALFRSSDIAPLCVLSIYNMQMPGGETFTAWQWGGRGPTSQRMAESGKHVFQPSPLSGRALPPTTMPCRLSLSARRWAQPLAKGHQLRGYLFLEKHAPQAGITPASVTCPFSGTDKSF